MARPSRREFLQQLAALGLSGYSASVLSACRSQSTVQSIADAGSSQSPITFSPARFALVAAMCERLFPRDEDPGALDLGVPDYIDRALAAPALAPFRALFLRALPHFEAQSNKRFGKPFSQAAADEQDQLLKAWQLGNNGDPKFFEALLAMTLEGAFGDPRHGGNRAGRGFQLIGFTPGPLMTKDMTHSNSDDHSH